MPLPAADSPDPIAVLVLAWDEATPAVRALVEATQASAPALDSLLVMVPRADAPAKEPSAAASQPLPTPLPAIPATAPASAAPATEAVASSAAASQVRKTESVLAIPGPVAPAANATVPMATAPAEPAELAKATPLAWAAVRVVRLGSLSLPQLVARAGQPLPAPVWTGATTAPAVPYLGAAIAAPPAIATPLPASSASVASLGLPIVRDAVIQLPALPPAPPSATPPPLPHQPAQPSPPAQAAPLYEATASIAQAPDLEADLALAEAAESVSLESAEASTLPLNESSVSAELTPAQADWEAALATLRQPAAQPEPAVPAPAEPATEAMSAAYPALRPATQHYPAPDLNFQIIQYARFAVPMALAEPAFAVLYAPAWPTWLAAQELRQRTGRPLVLHVASLAAAADESVDTATGWIAELQRQALRRADLLIAETPALAQRLRRELDLEASRVLAIAAADAAAIAQALRGARVRPAAA